MVGALCRVIRQQQHTPARLKLLVDAPRPLLQLKAQALHACPSPFLTQLLLRVSSGSSAPREGVVAPPDGCRHLWTCGGREATQAVPSPPCPAHLQRANWREVFCVSIRLRPHAAERAQARRCHDAGGVQRRGARWWLGQRGLAPRGRSPRVPSAPVIGVSKKAGSRTAAHRCGVGRCGPGEGNKRRGQQVAAKPAAAPPTHLD